MKGLSKKQLLKENQELREENARLRQEIELLRQKMDLLIRRVFGRSSEKLDASQLDLFLMAPESEPGKVDASSLEEADPRHEPRARRDARCLERWPADLPVVEQIIDPKEVQKAPQDWRLIGAEVSEQLDYEPGRFLRRRLVRRKYVRRGDPEAAPVIAALPPSLQERCFAAPGLLAHIIVSKYCDHLPLYRQEAIFGNRHGVHLPRQNMARWMGLAADWLRPIYEHIRTGVMAGGYLQIDETPIRYLSPGHGQTKLGYLWTALSPGGDVVYHWETSRAADCLKNVIAADFQGTIQCDAYVAYGSFVRKHERLSPCGPTRDATSTKRASRHRSVVDGSCARLAISTASRRICAAAEQVQGSAPLCARARVVPSASACTSLWSSSKSPAAICLAALLARPSTTPSPTGRYLASISKMAESK